MAKKMMPDYDVENFQRLCVKYHLSLVILHGSYAKGTNISRSDIDIGFLGETEIIKKDYFNILSDFSLIFGDKLEPVFLNGAEPMIAYHAAIYGKPLYEKKKGLFNSFRVAAIARYLDTNKFRVLEKQYIRSAIQKAG